MSASSHVSIIIPNYNHAKFLEQRIDSVLNQGYQDFEVILLDDCSTDDSKNVMEKYRSHPKVSHLIFNEKNSGSPFLQWKKGLSLARGKWIWIAESDDYCAPTFLESLLFNEKVTSDNLILYTQTFDVNEKGEPIADRYNFTRNMQPPIWDSDFYMKGTNFLAKYMTKKNVIPNASAVVFANKPQIQELLNDELCQMKMCGDWFFWSQLLEQFDIIFVNKHLNYFRTHSSVSRNHNNYDKRRKRLLEEKIVRQYFEKVGLKQEEEKIDLYRQWIYYNSFSDYFKIKIDYASFIKFLIIELPKRLLKSKMVNEKV